MRAPLLLTLSLFTLTFLAPARASAQHDARADTTWTAGLQLGPASGLPDTEVLHATWHGDRLVAGTREGLFAYDGLRWDPLLEGEAIYWVGSDQDEGRLLAGGDGGLWRVDLLAGRSERVAAAPDSIRCGWISPEPSTAAHSDNSPRIQLGTRHGLFTGQVDGSWTAQLDSLPITCLDRAPSGRLYVGTFGRGLYWSDPPNADRLDPTPPTTDRPSPTPPRPDPPRKWHTVRSPFVGVQDSLPGDFIHDLHVDHTGALHLATSAASADERYQIHENATLLGLVDEHQKHMYLGAAYARWDHETWTVHPLYQHYRVNRSHNDPETSLELEGDVDGDGDVELLLELQPGRNLAPRGLVCFDKATGRREWIHRYAGKTRNPLLVDGPDGPELLVLSAASDHGARYGPDVDHTSVLFSINADGHMRRLRTWPRTMVEGPSVLTRPGPEAVEPIGLYFFLQGLGEAHADEIWFLDLRTREWSRAPQKNRNYRWVDRRVLLEGDAHLCLTFSAEGPPELQLRDLREGTVRRSWPLHELMGGASRTARVQARLRRVEGTWQAVVWDGRRYAIVDHNRVRSGEFPLRGEDQKAGFVGDPRLRQPILVHNDAEGTMRLWRWPSNDGAPRIDEGAARPPVVFLGPPDDVPFTSVETDDLELLLEHRSEPAIRARSVGTRSHLQVSLDPSRDRWGLLTIANGRGQIQVFDNRSQLQERRPVPASLRRHEDLMWGEGLEFWTTSVDEESYLLPCHGLPYRAVRYDLRTGEVLQSYDTGLNFVDRRCIALHALAPDQDLVATDRGIKRGRWAVPADVDPWVVQASTRGMHLEDERGLAWGPGTVVTLREAGRCVDPAAEDLIFVEGESWLARASEILRFSTIEPGGRPRDRWTVFPNRAGVDRRWRLWRSGDWAWALQTPTDRTTPSIELFGLQDKDRLSLLRQTWEEGRSQPVCAAFALDEARSLVFADHGLLLADFANIEQPFPVLDDRWSFRAAIQDAEGWLAAGHRGAIVRVRRAGASFTLREVESIELPTQDRVRQMLATEEGVFVLSGTRIVHLDSGRTWVAQGGVEFRRLSSRHRGGLWVGTQEGLALLRLDSPDLVNLPDMGLPRAPVRRILEDPAKPSERLWVVMAGKGLFAVEPPAAPRARLQAEEDSVRVALWPTVSAEPAAVEWRWKRESRWRRAAVRPEPGAAVSFALEAPPQGRRELRVRVFDHFGRVHHPLEEARFTWRLSSPAVQGLVLFVLAALALALRWRPSLAGERDIPSGFGWVGRLEKLPWSLVFLVLGLFLLLGLHQFLLLDVPWSASAVLGVAVVGMDAINRRRDVRERLAPEAARAQLRNRIRQFRHRGGVRSPINQLLLVLRNLESLRDGPGDPLEEARDLCRQVLDSTAPLARELQPMARDAHVDDWLVDQVVAPLRFLRDRARLVLSGGQQGWSPLLESHARHSLVDAGRAFLRSIESLHEALAGEEGCDATRVVHDCVARYRHQADPRVGIEAELPGRSLPCRIPRAELEELLDNLVRNALQALDGQAAGRVLVRLSPSGRGLRLVVEDDGPGIDAALLPRIFEEGVSASGGTGFGLGRCRALVQSWGGTIDVTNGSDGGARVVVGVG